jgi:pimeloyl-ACP methyl ester carboxylesterase
MTRFFLGLLTFLILAPFTAAGAQQTPILFVHGNSDSAALWITTIWRFETNGYGAARLHTIDFRNPTARSDDGKPQPYRSSSADQLAELNARVDEVLRNNRASKLILVGASRGGLAIRNYLKHGGAKKVSHAILAATPNHGVIASDTAYIGSELNAHSPLLRELNTGPAVPPGVRMLTLRSDGNDKFAQPDGRYLGMPGTATNVGYDGPALAGAKNVVLPRLDHRQLAFDAAAFREMYRFVTGKDPARLDSAPVRRPVLRGMVTGLADGVPTNLPLDGAMVEVFEVSPATGERQGAPRYAKMTGPDGRWGPFRASPSAYYEFVLSAPGYPITHIYRMPFPRSSSIVHLRPGRLDDNDQGAGSVITLSRPRGYLGHGRDTFLLDGKIPHGVPAGVPSVSAVTIRLAPDAPRAVRAVVNEERLTVRSWPVATGHVVIAEVNE